MNHLIRLSAVVGGAICLLLGAHANAQTSSIKVHECAECATVTELYASAWDLMVSVPAYTKVLATSRKYPISALFETKPYEWWPVPAILTADDLEGVKLDNKVYARAAKVTPINVPSGQAQSNNAQGANWEFVGGYVQTVLVYSGFGNSVLHGFLPGSFGQFTYIQFLDTRSGEVHKIYAGDTITVRFQDGSTAQLKLIPAAPAGLYFHLVSDSERDPSGRPYGAPSAPSGGSGGTVNFVPPLAWAPSEMEAFFTDPIWTLVVGACMAKAQVSADDGWTWTRWVPIPCQ